MATTAPVIPLNITGNTTEEQQEGLRQFLGEVVKAASRAAIVAEQQPEQDILVVAAQMGRLHRGCSARRTRMVMLGNEFGLGTFAFGCILLTHPERMSTIDALNGGLRRRRIFTGSRRGVRPSAFVRV